MNTTRVYINQIIREDTQVEVDEFNEGETVAVRIDGYTLQGSFEQVAHIFATAHRQLDAMAATRDAVVS